MKKAKILLTIIALVGVMGGAVASKFIGIIYYYTTTITVPPTTKTMKATTTTTITAGTYYYYTTIALAIASNYSILVEVE